jgi:tetratricopeptide (TPR) repeat protein
VKAERLLNKTDTLQSLGYEISKLEMGTETYPENEINWIQLGDAYRKLGRFDKAIEAFQVARYLNPENLNTLNKLGNTAYQSGEIRSAITWYNNILSQNPKIPRIWFNLGIAYLSLDQIQDARDAFERVLEMDPDMQLAQEYLTKLSS